ncbi:hypothetical protein [Bowmanella yangjiangensis]|uniref:Uncharacterized protein n=1 Tax=Bowmanella yangjiangensis TaxID=2811230 RepID=A0ABS3CRL0_9ALTE|nr:hypothetical protein [Bowmanella yangjiangensis]MBN7819747.1 hypothetical protein [Bowmanella yangjiangensis]
MREMEVALAIALCFLIFSTISSMILEVLYRFKKTRYRGLKLMLKDFYESELTPLLHHKLTKAADFSDDFVKHILRLNKENHALSTSQFIQRLATSEIAAQIANRTTAEVHILINDIVRRYEDYGSAFSHRFKQFAERDNLIIGVAAAILLNVNVIAMTKTFLDNRGLTESLVSRSEAILESAQAQQERMQHLDKDAEDAEAFQAAVERLKQTVEESKGLDLPVGWSRNVLQYFEQTAAGLMCSTPDTESQTPPTQQPSANPPGDRLAAPQPYTNCKSSAQKVGFWGFAGMAWLFSTVITGLLVGLGGPFWFDVVKRISLFRNTLSNFATGKNTTTDSKTDEQVAKDYLALFTNANLAANMIKDPPTTVKPPAPSSIRLGKIVR